MGKLGQEWADAVLVENFDELEESSINELMEVCQDRFGEVFTEYFWELTEKEKTDFYRNTMYPKLNLIAPEGYEVESTLKTIRDKWSTVCKIVPGELKFGKIGEKLSLEDVKFGFSAGDIICCGDNGIEYVVYQIRRFIPEYMIKKFESYVELIEKENYFFDEIIKHINGVAPENCFLGLKLDNYGEYNWGFWSIKEYLEENNRRAT